MNNEELRIVYAKRHMVGDRGEWFSVWAHYTPDDAEKMYGAIACTLSDGCPDEEEFDLGHAPVNSTPIEDDIFDVAYGDTGFGEVRVSFDGHGTEYHF